MMDAETRKIGEERREERGKRKRNEVGKEK